MISKALVGASTKPIILSILLGGENYGYQIIHKVKEVSGGELEWAFGMLYPVLHRLEEEGLIRSRWKLSDGGKMRKYYAITEAGREDLEKEKRQWTSIQTALGKLWRPASEAVD
jgi:PadR family transcriptional regulator PadR